MSHSETNKDDGLDGSVGCIVKLMIGRFPVNLGLEDSKVGMSLPEANDGVDVPK